MMASTTKLLYGWLGVLLVVKVGNDSAKNIYSPPQYTPDGLYVGLF